MLERRVRNDCAVEVDGNTYSVPWRLIGEQVEVVVAVARCARSLPPCEHPQHGAFADGVQRCAQGTCDARSGMASRHYGA